jgi:dihydroorotate dehydrogenase/Pyruvate/2-oxoacid:ferredoxin oxidoreductase delta subunit
MCEEAGADAVSLHLNTGQNQAGRLLTEQPERLRRIIDDIKATASVPVIAKLPVEGCDPVALYRTAFECGADAVAPTSRFLGLCLDIEQETVPDWESFHGYGGPWALPITAAWLAQSRRKGVDGFLIPGGGVTSWQDVARLVLAGADMVQVCTWTIVKGYGVLAPALERLRGWMETKGYATLGDFRGRSLSRLNEAESMWGRFFEEGPYEGLTVDGSICNGCAACVSPCFYDAIHVGEDRKAHIDAAKCVGCGCCYQFCPIDAIRAEEISMRP